MSGAPFLTAEWRHLLIVNFELAPERLTPYLPAHTSLDLYQGRALVSLVGFRFLRTRVMGCPVPWHRDFDEMNLRFYVKRVLPDGAVRRGVTFLGEIVPRRAIAWIARTRYGEPYRALPMRHEVAGAVDGDRTAYACRVGERWHGISARVRGPSRPATDDPATAFITEHYWGYTRRASGRTDEYEVRHPVWRVRGVTEVDVTLDAGAVYGAPFASFISGPLHSACLAEGSGVEVHPGAPLPAMPGPA